MKMIMRFLSAAVLVAGSVGSLAVSATSLNSQNPSTVVSNFQTTFQGYNDPQLQVENAQTGDVWWITPDNFNILIQNSPQVKGYLTPFSMQITYHPEQRTFSPRLDKFIQQVDDSMSAQGFALDSRNSSINDNDSQFYDFIHAYQKGDTVCVLRIDPDQYVYTTDPKSRTDFDFGCTNHVQKNHDEQVPILKALPDQGQGVVISDQKEVGNFISVAVNYRRTGFLAFLENVNGSYVLRFAGQDIPPCSLVNKYHIPKAIYGECYDG